MMSFLNFKTNQPVITISKQLPMIPDAVSAYAELCSNAKGMTGLLETASISTKEHTRSLLVLSTALNIRCEGERVTVKASNANGRQLLPVLSTLIENQNAPVDVFENGISVVVSHSDLKSKIIETDKLLSPSVLDVLRLIMELLRINGRDDKTTYLVGGFSFDCYELFEELPETEDEKAFPDYDFYLADRLLVIDHQQNSSRLVSKVFNFEQVESVYFEYQQQLAQDELKLKHNKYSQYSNHAIEQSQNTVAVDLKEPEFCSLVEQAKKHIVNGDVFQVVLARNFTLACRNAFLAYQHLLR
jgi:anthranilate synthase component 1